MVGCGRTYPTELPDSYATRVSTIGITVYYQAPEDAEISIKTKQGDFSFRISDVPQTGPIHVLNTRVEIVRVQPVEHLSTPQYEDDYPSIASDGKATSRSHGSVTATVGIKSSSGGVRPAHGLRRPLLRNVRAISTLQRVRSIAQDASGLFGQNETAETGA